MSIIEGAVPRGAGVERGNGATYYADANNGSDNNGGGSWTSAKATLSAALALMGENDTLYISGRFREELLIPSSLAGGISIIGADDRLPSHSDSNWSGGATIMPPASPTATTPLLKIRAQGVTLKNILFDAPVDAAAVYLERNADETPATDEYDASHANIVNCRFVSGQTGIENAGGCGHVLVEDCRFYDLTDAILCSSTGVAVPLRWIVRDCTFIKNTNHIRSSMNDSVIRDSVFARHTTKSIDVAYNSGQGEYNTITRNALGGTYSIAGGYVTGANDEWGGNFNSLSGGVTAADPA